MSEQSAPESNKEQAAEASEFRIQRTYLKDMSFEAPMGAVGFLQEKAPSISQDLSTEISQVDADMYETVLKVTVTAKIDDKTLFLVEVQQAGIFLIKGMEQQQLGHVLNTVCPQVIFPYIRESIDSALVKATFPPVMLPPVNFEALYAQALKEQTSQPH